MQDTHAQLLVHCQLRSTLLGGLLASRWSHRRCCQLWRVCLHLGEPLTQRPHIVFEGIEFEGLFLHHGFERPRLFGR